MSQALLEMKNIQKYFPGVHALDDAFISVNKGEVHALVGENGAGKSTLMKILTGIFKKDGGTITYLGREIEPANPKHSQELGIGIIHQELNLMPHLSAAQNIFIGKEPMLCKGDLIKCCREYRNYYHPRSSRHFVRWDIAT